MYAFIRVSRDECCIIARIIVVSIHVTWKIAITKRQICWNLLGFENYHFIRICFLAKVTFWTWWRAKLSSHVAGWICWRRLFACHMKFRTRLSCLVAFSVFSFARKMFLCIETSKGWWVFLTLKCFQYFSFQSRYFECCLLILYFCRMRRALLQHRYDRKSWTLEIPNLDISAYSVKKNGYQLSWISSFFKFPF